MPFLQVTSAQDSITLGCISVPAGGNCFDKIIAYGGIVNFYAEFVSHGCCPVKKKYYLIVDICREVLQEHVHRSSS